MSRRAKITLVQIIVLSLLLLMTMLVVPDRSVPSELTDGVDRAEVVGRWSER
jgi:hypothetical protein